MQVWRVSRAKRSGCFETYISVVDGGLADDSTSVSRGGGISGAWAVFQNTDAVRTDHNLAIFSNSIES